MLVNLQREIGKRQPFDVVEEEAFLNLLRTASQLNVECERLLRTKDLSGPTYNILRILGGAGSEGRLCHEISKMLITEVPDVTRLVDRLEKRDLVARHRQKEDRRTVRVAITEQGCALLEELAEPVRALHQQQLGHLSPTDLAEFNRLLVAARQKVAK